MLLKNTCEIIKSLNIKLVFDDESVKNRTIEVGDLVDITFNKDGMRRSIEGTVKKIEDESCPKKTHWYIIVDGSTSNIARIEKIYTEKILDVEVTRKANQTSSIGSPMDSTRIVSMRLVGGILQVSQDGIRWTSVVKVPETESEVIVNPEDQELAAKIARLIPKRIPADRRIEMIQNLVDLYNEELSDAIADEENADSSVDSGTDTDGAATGDSSTEIEDSEEPIEPDDITTEDDNTTI